MNHASGRAAIMSKVETMKARINDQRIALVALSKRPGVSKISGKRLIFCSMPIMGGMRTSMKKKIIDKA